MDVLKLLASPLYVWLYCLVITTSGWAVLFACTGNTAGAWWDLIWIVTILAGAAVVLGCAMASIGGVWPPRWKDLDL